MVLATVLLAIAASMTTALAAAATCHQFDIIIDSQVSSNYGSVQNRTREIAVVRDQGVRNHNFELLIRYPDDLNGFDVRAGVIELMTNSAFTRNRGMASAGFDLGSIMDRGNTFTFQLDQGAAFQIPPPNMFAAPVASNGRRKTAAGLDALTRDNAAGPVIDDSSDWRTRETYYPLDFRACPTHPNLLSP